MDHREILDSCRKSYQIAIEEFSNHKQHKHPHWERYHKDFHQSIYNENSWKSFRRNSISTGLDDANKSDNPHYDKQKAHEKLEKSIPVVVENIDPELVYLLNDSSVGNPNLFKVHGYQTNSVIRDLVYSAQSINEVIPTPLGGGSDLRIVDIGGGYGGMLRLLKLMYRASKCYSFDLPESNFISEYYLRNCFPTSTFFTLRDFIESKSIEDADFTILPGWHIDALPNTSIDLVINTRSMMEMEVPIIKFYMKQINRICKTRSILYCVNKPKKHTPNWGSRKPYYLHKTPFGFKWQVISCSELRVRRAQVELVLKKIDGITLPPGLKILLFLVWKHRRRAFRWFYPNFR